MKKYTLFFVCALVSLFAAATIYAQGFTGPSNNLPPPPPRSSHTPPPPPPGYLETSDRYGFTGPVRTVTIEQAKAFEHRTPVVVAGTIVQAIGGDLYIFSDSTGEITLRIGPREWHALGSNISPSDKIEINGELHRNQKDWQRAPEIHARYIRKL
jgi:uncharacterized protein (TIGR00156 family)